MNSEVVTTEMRKYYYILAFLFIATIGDAWAQFAHKDSLLRSDTAHFESSKSLQNNAFFAELGGNGRLLSLNLDFRYKSHYSLRVGLALYTIPNNGIDPNPILTSGGIVTMANYLFFNTLCQMEVGIGMITDITSKYRSTILDNNYSRFKPTLFFGFRYQPFSLNHILRIGYTPFFDLHQVIHWAGISYGWCIDPF